MRTPLLAFTIAGFVLAPSLAQADAIVPGQTILIQQTDINGNALVRPIGGGPFRVDLPGIIDDFLTFCLELNETALLNTPVTVQSITNEARAGGVDGVPPGGTGDPISGMTAFLYTQFRVGNPSYANGFNIQTTIWFLEQEHLTPFNGDVNALIAQATADMAALGWGANDLGAVRVMNLLGPNGSAHQDMLMLDGPPNPQTPIPEPASLILLGSGLLAGRYYRQRRRTPRG